MPRDKLGLRERIAERREKVFSLMRAGVMRRRVLAKALGVCPATVQGDIMAVLKELREKTLVNAEAMRDLGVARCDEIIAALWPERKKPPAALAILKAEERRARLYGLDMPSKMALTDPTGEHEYPTLTDDERIERLTAILDNARARRDRQAALTATSGDESGRG